MPEAFGQFLVALLFRLQEARQIVAGQQGLGAGEAVEVRGVVLVGGCHAIRLYQHHVNGEDSGDAPGAGAQARVRGEFGAQADERFEEGVHGRTLSAISTLSGRVERPTRTASNSGTASRART